MRLLIAFLAVLAMAGEPPPAPRPVVMTGRVVRAMVEAGDYGYELVPSSGRRTRKPDSYPLMPASDPHRRLILDSADRLRDVEVVGVLRSVEVRDILGLVRVNYIVIESIKELP